MSSLPRSRLTPNQALDVVGRPTPTEADRPRAYWVATSASYAEVLGLPVLSGRFFDANDGPEDEPVAVVSRAFVEEHFGEGEALGARIALDRDPEGSRARTDGRRIVGVVDDAAQARLTLTGVGDPVVYLPTRQAEVRELFVAAVAPIGAGEVGRLARDVVAGIDPTLPVATVRTLREHIDAELSGPRIIAVFLGGMGVIALLLAAIGIYGVMAHSVVQRTREIGIRMAMGAERGSVIGLVTRNGMTLVLAGLVAGVPLSWGMVRLVQSGLAELTTVLSPVGVFLTVAAGLAGIAAVACLVPAIRAATIQPVRALRSEA